MDDQEGMTTEKKIRDFYYPLKSIMLQKSRKTNGLEFIPFNILYMRVYMYNVFPYIPTM